MQKRERSILIVACYGHFMSHFNMLVFPAILLPLSAQLNLGMAETLGLSFLMYLMFGVTALPWGLLADRYGARPLLALFHLGAGVFALLTAMNLDNPLMLSLSLAGIGVFSGIYHPAGLGWIAKETENTSRAMSYNGVFGNFGLAAAPLVAGLVNYLSGIELLYVIVAGMNLAGLALLWGGRNGTGAVPAKKKNDADKNLPSWTPFIVLLIAMTLGGIIYRGTSVTLPAYFELKNIGLYTSLSHLTGGIGSPNVIATLLASLIYLFGMAGQLFGGRVGEKYDLRYSYLLFHLITIPAAIGMAMTSNIPLVCFAIVHGFFLLGMQPIENTLVARLTPPNLISSAYGMKFILTFGVGALSVKIIKIIQTQWGIEYVFFGLSLVSVVLCMIVVILIKVIGNRVQ